ncbi:MAG: hypothetical protein Ct9H300mP1_27810 [Planctomycetaceae bacterium]|nr:MAG: hypothetical protein Ct9H300mP1_27810 [Planctomycetaceae bacterium]
MRSIRRPTRIFSPDALIHDFDGDGHKDIWTEKRFYRNTGKYGERVPVFPRVFQDRPETRCWDERSETLMVTECSR